MQKMNRRNWIAKTGFVSMAADHTGSLIKSQLAYKMQNPLFVGLQFFADIVHNEKQKAVFTVNN